METNENFFISVTTADSATPFLTVPHNKIYLLDKLTISNEASNKALVTITDEFTTEDGTAHTETVHKVYVASSATLNYREDESKRMLNEIKVKSDQTPVDISVSAQPL